MEKKQSVANLVVQMYGVKALKELLIQMPEDSMYLAISRNKLACIFYKHSLGEFDADYRNGFGWVSTRQVTLNELEQDLSAVSFMLIGVEDLTHELAEYQDNVQTENIPLVRKLNDLIETQITRAHMRSTADVSDVYWKGHLDAYDIVQNAIRPHLQGI